jgi:hypothetical protein
MSSANSGKKLILVIGATGAQGIAVIDALLAPAADGSASPYAIRALTRNAESNRSKELAAKGVELFQGKSLINVLLLISESKFVQGRSMISTQCIGHSRVSTVHGSIQTPSLSASKRKYTWACAFSS